MVMLTFPDWLVRRERRRAFWMTFTAFFVGAFLMLVFCEYEMPRDRGLFCPNMVSPAGWCP